MQRLLVAVVVAIAICVRSHTTTSNVTWNSASFPNPETDGLLCGHDGPSWVCDPDNLLTSETVSTLNALIDKLQLAKECACSTGCKYRNGAVKVGVAIVRRIMLPDGTVPSTASTKRAAVKHFATNLRTVTWKFADCDDDLVIAISQLDGQIWTDTGSATREWLPDECVNEIIDETLPIAESVGFGEALAHMIRAYRDVLLGNKACEGTSPPSKVRFRVWYLVVAVAAAVVLFLLAKVVMTLHRSRSQRQADTALNSSGEQPARNNAERAKHHYQPAGKSAGRRRRNDSGDSYEHHGITGGQAAAALLVTGAILQSGVDDSDQHGVGSGGGRRHGSGGYRDDGDSHGGGRHHESGGGYRDDGDSHGGGGGCGGGGGWGGGGGGGGGGDGGGSGGGGDGGGGGGGDCGD